jgi:hypothetical protein
MDEELWHIGRVLATACGHDGTRERSTSAKTLRIDAAHAVSAAPHGANLPEPARRPAARSSAPVESGGLIAAFTWVALSLGTTAFVCGGVLLGWSVFAQRQELWSVGMPIALAGQIALLIGLVLQLDRLWHNSRKASAKLENVDKQLHELKTATTLASTVHGPSATFYAHLAGGASPQLLLTDLKSQLDLLAAKLSKEAA